jgi:O-succinylbenzoic acid--CoA ligase
MERAELAARLAAGRQTPSDQSQTTKLVSEADPQRFMAAFAAAVAGDGDVFLCDPQWAARELADVATLMSAGLAAPKPPGGEGGWLMIPTGGSSGRLKFARHDSLTLAAAVAGFRKHFGIERINAAGVLPLHHVSGLMAWLRCALTGGDYLQLDWKAVEAGERPALPSRDDGWVVSLVPTQLARLLRDQSAVDWLRSYRIIFLGGAPASPGLLDRAADLGLPLSPGYGMTETAAMVAALRPEEFLAGVRSNGAALPHARVALDAAGAITIGGDSVFRGYYPDWREGAFVTADLGRIDERGHLHVLGRGDAVIITGGEKVQPTEVEAVLRDTGEFDDVIVLGLPDAEWGQIVVAAFPATADPDLKRVEQVINSHLAAYKRPKRYVPVADWPATAAGKVSRTEIARRIWPG